jgi:hypothetical protein
MPIAIVERITLYADQTDLVDSLRAQPLTAAGAATGALITTGFVALGGADYRFSGNVPDDTECVRYELSSNAGVAIAVGDRVANLQASPTVGQIADAVWDEALSGHETAGSAGKALSDAALSQNSVQLVNGPYELTIEGAGPDGVLEVRRGDILTVRAALKALSGQAINLTGATLTAKIVGLDETDLVTGLTVTALQADEGTVTVVLDLTDSDLANVRRARLVITRTVGSSDITSYPTQLLFQ